MPTVHSKLPDWATSRTVVITSSAIITIIIGRYIVQKMYMKSLSEVITEETAKHEINREKKVLKTETVERGTNEKISFSDPVSPANYPTESVQAQELTKGFFASGGSLKNSNLISKFPRRRGVPSLASTQSNLTLRTPEELIVFGNEYLKRALKIWDDTKHRIDLSETEHQQNLDNIIIDTKKLIENIDSYMKNLKKSKELKEVKGEAAEEQDQTEDASIYDSPDNSLDSFATLAYYDVEPNMHFFKLYNKALEEKDFLLPRIDRTIMLNCESQEEFYAKVICLRQAFEFAFKSAKTTEFFTKMGEEILTVLLKHQNENVENCLAIYHRFIEYVCDKENHELLEEEIKYRQIPCLSFYDLVIDYVILDSFEDLENPPSSIVSVVNHRWIGTNFKIGTLKKAIETVIRYKRAKLKVEGGFFTNFYDLLTHISPVLAWGFLGTDTDLKIKCNLIKHSVMELVRDYFDFNRVRYTTVNDLAEDLVVVSEIRFDDLQSKLSIFD